MSVERVNKQDQLRIAVLQLVTDWELAFNEYPDYKKGGSSQLMVRGNEEWGIIRKGNILEIAQRYENATYLSTNKISLNVVTGSIENEWYRSNKAYKYCSFGRPKDPNIAVRHAKKLLEAFKKSTLKAHKK